MLASRRTRSTRIPSLSCCGSTSSRPSRCLTSGPWELRQLVTHRQLVARQRTAVRNAIYGILHRKLLRCPYCEPFGRLGRAWLLAQDLTESERFMLENDLALLARSTVG